MPGRLPRDTFIDRRDQRLGLLKRHKPRLARRIDFGANGAACSRGTSISAAIDAMP